MPQLDSVLVNDAGNRLFDLVGIWVVTDVLPVVLFVSAVVIAIRRRKALSQLFAAKDPAR